MNALRYWKRVNERSEMLPTARWCLLRCWDQSKYTAVFLSLRVVFLLSVKHILRYSIYTLRIDSLPKQSEGGGGGGDELVYLFQNICIVPLLTMVLWISFPRWEFVSELPTVIRGSSESLNGSQKMGDGGIFLNTSAPHSLIKTFWMKLISAGSISLNSAFKWSMPMSTLLYTVLLGYLF